MPTIHEIETALYRLAPQELAMPWDNVGLLIGDPQDEVHRVLVALDVTEDVAEEAIRQKAELIVAHHPVMNCKWNPVQTIREDFPQGHLFRRLIKAGVAAICMHTNLDAAPGGVNDALAETLGVMDTKPLTAEGIGRFGVLKDGPMPLSGFVRIVSKKLHGNGLRYCDAGKEVFRIAVGGGACGDYVEQAIAVGCDTFVTADLRYHEFLDAVPKGINLIDAGHFPTEDLVCEVLIRYLQEEFPTLWLQKSTSHREVIQYYVEEGEI